MALAITEYLNGEIGAKTIFATHYHELTQLAELLPGVVNFNVAAQEEGDHVVFLHRLVPGGADRSYGVEVARMAGVPTAVVSRAREILRTLEGSRAVESRVIEHLNPAPVTAADLAHRAASPPRHGEDLEERIRAADLNRMTPLDALVLLADLQTRLQG